MRIFFRKAVKTPQRRGRSPRTPVGFRWLGALSPDTRIVTTPLTDIDLCLLFTSNFKYLATPENFFAPLPDCVGLAPALCTLSRKMTSFSQKVYLSARKNASWNCTFRRSKNNAGLFARNLFRCYLLQARVLQRNIQSTHVVKGYFQTGMWKQ